jgi:GPH family glycoside/pentoside/hexuronide:cation symporter
MSTTEEGKKSMEAAKKRNIAYIENVKNAPAFGLRDKIGYLCGDLGFNSLQVIVNSYLMLFCVNILGMNAVHFAGIVFICKALDALNDTFIGRTVDRRAPAKNGKMKPYLLWFAVPYAIFTLILFMNVHAMPYAAKIAWVLIIYFCWGIIGTFINVPYGAMSNIITTNQIERTELSNFRSIGSFAASMGTTTIAPLLLFDQNNDPIAGRFILLSVILGVFCTVCLFLAHTLIHERVLVEEVKVNENGEKINYLQVAKSFLHNRVMIAVVASYVIVKLFIQPVSTLNQYVFMTYFQDTSSLAMASLTTMGPMLLGMVFLKPLVKRFGKKALVTWPLLGSALMHGANMLLPLGPKEWIFCQLMASACITCLNLLLWSLIADAVDYQAYLTGQRNDGTVYATITFIVFFAASASTSIIALLLEAVGYDPTLGSMGQLAGVPEKIKMLGGAWPMIGALLSFVCFKFIYNVSDARMREISEELRRKSEETEERILNENAENEA